MRCMPLRYMPIPYTADTSYDLSRNIKALNFKRSLPGKATYPGTQYLKYPGARPLNFRQLLPGKVPDPGA
jgi:hypothetical protein